MRRNARALRLAAGALACAAACHAPPPYRMIPIAAYERAEIGELHSLWQVPLVIVRDVVYAPPPGVLPLAPDETRERVARLAGETPPVDDPRVMELPCHPVRGHHEFVVRGVGYRRMRSYDDGTFLEERDRTVPYEPAPEAEGGSE